MALSPAQRHSQRIAMEQKLKRSQALETTESMHLLVKALETDVGHVRSLPTIADRIEFKRDVLLPRWVPIVEAYLESKQVYANPVFAWCVIWLFDVGELDQALEWADYPTIGLLKRIWKASRCTPIRYLPGVLSGCLTWASWIRRWNGLISQSVSNRPHRISYAAIFPRLWPIRCWHGRRKAPGAEKVLSRISPVRLNVWQGYGDCMSR
ncbi:phage terminase small subunit [Salmonella enterica]|uniref:phage terminase small subunit n=1 Tax=Salmonella enterica TaxID=28901 RepID=UPI003735FC73